MEHPTSFFTVLASLGKTDKELAKKIAVAVRTASDYRRGKLPRFAKILLHHPALAEALADDAKAGRTNGFHYASSGDNLPTS